jgi:hypothetical protein
MAAPRKKKAPRAKKDQAISKKKPQTRKYKLGQRPKWAAPFLKALSENGGAVRAAAATAGRSEKTAHSFRGENKDFADEWDATVSEAKVYRLRELATSSLDRAINGYLDPVYYEGVAVGARRKYDFAREAFHLKNGLPKEYNIASGDPTGGSSGETPEQLAAKIRAYVLAMQASVPRE